MLQVNFSSYVKLQFYWLHPLVDHLGRGREFPKISQSCILFQLYYLKYNLYWPSYWGVWKGKRSITKIKCHKLLKKSQYTTFFKTSKSRHGKGTDAASKRNWLVKLSSSYSFLDFSNRKICQKDLYIQNLLVKVSFTEGKLIWENLSFPKMISPSTIPLIRSYTFLSI